MFTDFDAVIGVVAVFVDDDDDDDDRNFRLNFIFSDQE